MDVLVRHFLPSHSDGSETKKKSGTLFCFSSVGLVAHITVSPDLRASSHICTQCQKPAREKKRFSKEQERSFNTKVAFPGISGGAPPAPYLLKIVSTKKPPHVKKDSTYNYTPTL